MVRRPSSAMTSGPLVAFTIAETMPGAASWVGVIETSTNPATLSPSAYSAKERAPAMQADVARAFRALLTALREEGRLE